MKIFIDLFVEYSHKMYTFEPCKLLQVLRRRLNGGSITFILPFLQMSKKVD